MVSNFTRVIKSLAERAWRICTVESDRLLEIERIKLLLRRNDYPDHVVEEVLGKFLERKARIAEQEPSIGPEKMKRYIKLPYVSRMCDEFERELKELVSKSFPQVDLVVAYSAPMTIQKLFPFKDNIKNVKERSMVVYKMQCDTCNSEYIGMSTRILTHRIKEHKTLKASACKQHIEKNPSHVFNYDDVEVLDNAETEFKLRIKELLHILKRKPILNKQLGTNSKYEIKTILIRAYA